MADETVAKNWSPAFPLTVESADGSVTTFQGMMLRDWFAGKALSSAYKLCVDAAMITKNVEDATADEVAKAAYELADAMLKARGDG